MCFARSGFLTNYSSKYIMFVQAFVEEQLRQLQVLAAKSVKKSAEEGSTGECSSKRSPQTDSHLDQSARRSSAGSLMQQRPDSRTDSRSFKKNHSASHLDAPGTSNMYDQSSRRLVYLTIIPSRLCLIEMWRSKIKQIIITIYHRPLQPRIREIGTPICHF